MIKKNTNEFALKKSKSKSDKIFQLKSEKIKKKQNNLCITET